MFGAPLSVEPQKPTLLCLFSGRALLFVTDLAFFQQNEGPRSTQRECGSLGTDASAHLYTVSESDQTLGSFS